MKLNKEQRTKQLINTSSDGSVRHEQKNKFYMDRTLYKGIKNYDVAQIIDTSKESGTIQGRIEQNNAEYLIMITNETRKKYDEVLTQVKNTQNKLKKQSGQLEQLKEQQSRLKNYVSSTISVQNMLNQNCQSQQKYQKYINDVVEARTFDLNIYKSMQARLKHDILLIKKRNYDKGQILKKDKIKSRILQGDQFNKTKISYRCRDILQSVETTVHRKVVQRNNKINSFHQALDKRKSTLINQELRQKQIESVMISAMSEKLHEQNECINIFLANKFMKMFFKNKMERIIQNNAITEGVYHKIRSHSNIRESRELISRFLNREKNYGNILENISQRESIQQNLQTQRKLLQQERSSLCQTQLQLHQYVFHRKEQTSLSKTLLSFEQKIQNIKYSSNLMKKWSIRFKSSFHNQTRQQTVKQNVNPFQDVLKLIVKYLQILQEDQKTEQKMNRIYMQSGVNSKLPIFEDHDTIAKNNRVKTAIDESMLDNQGHNDGISQIDFMHHNRRTVKRSQQAKRFRIKTQSK